MQNVVYLEPEINRPTIDLLIKATVMKISVNKRIINNKIVCINNHYVYVDGKEAGTKKIIPLRGLEKCR